MIQPTPPPAHLVDERGQVTCGVFDAPCRDINLVDARLRWHGLPLPRPAVAFRLKQWQHFGLVMPDLFLGLAIVNTGLLRTSWCHVVDRLGGEHFEHQRLSPALDLRVARELWNDRTYVHAGGYRVDVYNHLDAGEHRMAIRVDPARGKPAVQASLRFVHDLERNRPLVVVLPVGPNRGMYSHKVVLPMEGTVRVGDRMYRAEAEECFAILDIHKAHYPRHTWWNWATAAGRDEQGRALAFNLTRNVNPDDERYNENGFWVDGELTHLGPARFEFDPANYMTPWRLGTVDKTLDLEFQPLGERSDNINTGVIRSVFHQPYGTFSGTVKLAGETVRVESLYGVCEDHDALW